MTPERWRQLEELYDAVKDLSPAERSLRLKEADPELRSAAEAMFAQGSALEAMDFVTPYLKAVLRTLGVTNVTVIAAEGTAQLRSGNVDPQSFLAPSFEKVQAHAGLR